MIAGIVLGFLPGCSSGKAERYGDLAGDIAPSSIGSLLDAPELHLGEEVAVAGRIVEVCREVGCWFQVTEAGRRLLVDLGGPDGADSPGGWSVHARDEGRNARVVGRLIRREGVLIVKARGVELGGAGRS